MKCIDLHVHSNCSDGTLSPCELAIHAKNNGLSAIALTDHDTLSGVKPCLQKGLEIGLEVLPGIEFSTHYQDREIHILGYGIDLDNTILHQTLHDLIQNRNARNLQMLEKLNALGFHINKEDLKLGTLVEPVLTRAHFATALYHKGYAKSRHEAFELYIGKDKPAYIPRTKLKPETCIEIIHHAGGIAVLAHPQLYGFKLDEKKQLIKHLVNIGLDGVETFYPSHTPDDVLELLNFCSLYHLLPTGGSDFHGENKPDLKIGIGYGELKVSYDILDAIYKKLCYDRKDYFINKGENK